MVQKTIFDREVWGTKFSERFPFSLQNIQLYFHFQGSMKQEQIANSKKKLSEKVIILWL